MAKYNLSLQIRLKAMGKWMQQYGESIYGTRGNIIPPQDWGIVTIKDKIDICSCYKKTFADLHFYSGSSAKNKEVVLLVNKRSVEIQTGTGRSICIYRW